MLKLIGVGDNTVDTYLQERIRYPGGNAVNVAVLAKRFGVESAYLGSLGDDALGSLLLESLAAEGVDTSHCKVQAGVENAYVEVNLQAGDRVFGQYASGAAAMLHLSPQDLAYIRNFDIVHTSVYSFLEGQVESLRDASQFLSVDFSSDLDEAETIQRWLPHVDLAACSLSEHPYLTVEAVAQDYVHRGARLVLVTMGSRGSWVYDGETLHHQAIVPVEVVDTMGAGDAYIAAFLVEYRLGKGIPAAMASAANFAAQACRHAGAFGYGQSYP